MRLLRTISAVLLALGLLACSGSGAEDRAEDRADDGAEDPPPALAEGAFPLTVEHRFGETVVEEAPTRVATVGLTDHDAVLALGVTPVGTTDWYGGHPAGVWPWATDELGDAEPILLGDSRSVDEEAVIEADPDVILALYSGLTQEQYDDLSRYAPVIAPPATYDDYGIPWQEQTQIIGDVLGRPDEAERLVADTEQLVTDAADAHPELAGATTVVASAAEGVYVYSPQSAVSRVLADLGLVVPEGLVDLIGEDFGAEVSLEQIDLVDLDTVLWLDAADDRPPFSIDAYASLPVHQEGREIRLATDGALAGGSFISVLSLPVILDRLVPMLAAAVDGDPATEVPAEE